MTNSAELTYNQQAIYNNVNTTPVKKSSKVLSVILGIIAIIVGIVIYAVTYSNSYNETRDSSYSHSSSYSSYSKDSNDKNSIKQTKFSVDYVKSTTLEGYESKTIGEAFDDAFDETEWSYSKNGDTQYVEFVGSYSYEENNIGVYVVWYNAPSIHAENGCTLAYDASMIMDLDTDEYLYFDESSMKPLLSYIYNNNGFGTPYVLWYRLTH